MHYRTKKYVDVTHKRIVQNEIFNKISNPVIRALAGPNVDIYYKLLKQHGFKDITFFENDPVILATQFASSNLPYKLIFDDITNNLDAKVFYDLDFCCCVYTIAEHLPKINRLPEFSMTISPRPVGTEKTMRILKSHENGNHYNYYEYFDTVPMIVVSKTKIK